MGSSPMSSDSTPLRRRSRHPTQEHQTKAMDKMEQYVSEQKIAHAERTAPQMSYIVQ
jgi:hypothetical protein